MEIALILMGMALALIAGCAYKLREERDEKVKNLASAMETMEELVELKTTLEANQDADIGIIKELSETVIAQKTQIEVLKIEIEGFKQVSVNDREALKSALDEVDNSNAEARNLAYKVEQLQKALNQEQDVIIELEDKILSLKLKAKKAKAKPKAKKKK